MLLEFARWIQSTKLNEVLAGSLWGYLAVAALHVLGLAWFGGAALLGILRGRPRRTFLWTGAALMLVTGALLSVIEPQRCATSRAFWIKLLLLAALAILTPFQSKLPRKLAISLSVMLWVAVVLASRGIAFL
jgi:hypothetical protein